MVTNDRTERLEALLNRTLVALPVLRNMLKTTQLAGADIAQELIDDINQEMGEPEVRDGYDLGASCMCSNDRLLRECPKCLKAALK